MLMILPPIERRCVIIPMVAVICCAAQEWPQALRLLCTTEEVNNVSYAAAISAMEKDGIYIYIQAYCPKCRDVGMAFSFERN